MKDLLIQEYINRLTLDDINAFAKQEGITVNEEEKKIIYSYLKEHWRTILYGNPRGIFDELKNKLNPDTYNKVEQLYIQAKNKIGF
jgi:hypothetical protein